MRQSDLTREELYKAIFKYQREANLKELKKLTSKLTKILLDIFKRQVEAEEIQAARYTYHEIENMWDSYQVKRTDMDSILKVLINLFIEKNNFSIATILINKLNSLKIKQELTTFLAESEDTYRTSIKKEMEDIVERGIDVIRDFGNAELEYRASIKKEMKDTTKKFIKNNLKDSYIYFPRKIVLEMWRVYGASLMRSKMKGWKIRPTDLEFFDRMSKYLFKHRKKEGD